MELSSLGRVKRTRFGNNLDWSRFSSVNYAPGGDLRGGGIAEAPSADWSSRVAVARSSASHAVSEACAGDDALLAVRATSSVAMARAGWQIEGSDRSYRQFSIFVGLAGNSVGIAESSGLYLPHRSLDSRLC